MRHASGVCGVARDQSKLESSAITQHSERHPLGKVTLHLVLESFPSSMKIMNNANCLVGNGLEGCLRLNDSPLCREYVPWWALIPF